MQIYFSILTYDGQRYGTGDPGIAIVDYADFLAWNEARDERFWEKVRRHFNAYARFAFTFAASPDVSIREIEKAISDHIGFDWNIFSNARNWVCCLYMEGQFVKIENDQITLGIISKYYNLEDELRLFFLFSNQAGEIWKEDGLRYYMPSREYGSHNKPHIHVNYKHESSASICLLDGSVLSGNLPSKPLKRAIRKISENQKFLLDCWNKNTDGLKVDLNHYFGVVHLERDLPNSPCV